MKSPLVQEQLNRNETMSAAQTANKENEGRLDFDTVANADSNKKLKKLTSSGSKAGIKIRGQASRIVSSFKTQSIVSSQLVREFSGIHNDGN